MNLKTFCRATANENLRDHPKTYMKNSLPLIFRHNKLNRFAGVLQQILRLENYILVLEEFKHRLIIVKILSIDCESIHCKF